MVAPLDCSTERAAERPHSSNPSRTLLVTLPWPPSNNTYYRRVGNRTVISARGRAYRETVAAMLRGVETRRGRLMVHVDAYPPDRRKRDLDNLWKGLLDALQHAGVIEDDGDIDHESIARQPRDKPGRVEVWITEVVNP